MEFFCYETGETIKAKHRPLIIMTSNNDEDDSIVRISTRVNESAENLNRKELLEKINYDLQTQFNLPEER